MRGRFMFLGDMPRARSSKAVPPAEPSNIVERLYELVGHDEILETGRRLGVVQRQRKVDLRALVEASHFHPRCPHAMPRCKAEVPVLREVAPGHRSACHLNEATA